MYHGFAYDISELAVVEGENLQSGYNSAKANQKTIESKLFLPEIKISSIQELKPTNLRSYLWTEESEKAADSKLPTREYLESSQGKSSIVKC